MKTNLIYVLIVTVLSECSEFGHAKEILDVLIDTSGGGLPVANDQLYNFYIKDYFGLIGDYTEQMAVLKSNLDQDYKRWTGQFKSNVQSLELVKTAYTQVIDDLSAYLQDVLLTYGQVTPIGISDIVTAVNHMRKYEREFFSKINLNSQKCHEVANRNSFYKFEYPGIRCANEAIILSITIQLQYTYSINMFYARFVDQFNLFAGIADGEKQNYVAEYLKLAKEELQRYSRNTVQMVQNLGQEVAVCSKKSYEMFEKLKKSIDQEAVGCF